MKLYFLNRKDLCGYDERQSFVVRAKSPVAARKLVNARREDEGEIWLDPGKVTCKELKTDGPERTICIEGRDG